MANHERQERPLNPMQQFIRRIGSLGVHRTTEAHSDIPEHLRAAQQERDFNRELEREGLITIQHHDRA